MPRVRTSLTTACLGALLAASPATTQSADADPPSLEALMEGMAGTSGVVAEFRERKEIRLLSEPIETRGRLIFVPPDRLLRTTSEPSRSWLLIDGDRFAFRDDAGANTLDVSSNRLVREFVANFIVLFNGDLEALRERYEPEFRAEAERWHLTLRPRRAPLADVMERIDLEGDGRALRQIEMRETDGDRTVTRFEEVEVDRSFESEELDRIFSLPEPEPEAP